MELKDTFIHIPEIPADWTKRIRGGHTNIWNEGSTDPEKPEIKLTPAVQGLYAEHFPDATPAGWYWVCGCNTCLENDESYSYIVCHEHNRCVTCGIHREDLTDIPWGTPKGFQCKPCAQKEKLERKQKALTEARRNDHSEMDCMFTSEITCPACGLTCDSDIIDPDETDTTVECPICDTPFRVEVEYEPSYTTTLVSDEDE